MLHDYLEHGIKLLLSRCGTNQHSLGKERPWRFIGTLTEGMHWLETQQNKLAVLSSTL